MNTPATFSVAADTDTLTSIDHNAEKQGLSRSAYVLQWLPDAQPLRSKITPNQAADGRRKRRTRSELSSAQ